MAARVKDGPVDAGRDPASIRRILNVNGQNTTGASEGMLHGPVDQWVDELTDLAVSFCFDTFVLWAEGEDQLARFSEDVVPAVRHVTASPGATLDRSRPVDRPLDRSSPHNGEIRARARPRGWLDCTGRHSGRGRLQPRRVRLVRATPAGDHEQGLPEDERVEGERPVLDIPEIETDRLLPVEVGPPADLPKPSEPGLDDQPPSCV